MQIPIVTSIWRTLDDIEGGLEATWAAARPIFQSGLPDAILRKFKTELAFSIPEPPTADFRDKDRMSILAILEAYNRSNGLNLIALTALIREPETITRKIAGPPESVPIPKLHPLLEKATIRRADWALLEKTKHIGAIHQTNTLPTLWRHLIHWPRFIELVIDHYQPLHEKGLLFRMAEKTTEFIESEARALSHLKDSSVEIPQEAFQMVKDYVEYPPSVSRMTSIGHSVAQWFSSHQQVHF